MRRGDTRGWSKNGVLAGKARIGDAGSSNSCSFEDWLQQAQSALGIVTTLGPLMKNDRLERDIAEQVRCILLPYLQKLHDYQIDTSAGEVEVKEKISDNKASRTLILRAAIDHENKQIHIPNAQFLSS